MDPHQQCALPNNGPGPLHQLLVEAACNQSFANWLFTDPSGALAALLDDATATLGPRLPGSDFAVAPIALSAAHCEWLIALRPRSLAHLARAIQRWERQESREVPRNPIASVV